MASKRLKMCKKALCLIFAFLFSIESFAAVVSDNDGSAFVTKAEFEALKENFADQIINYNTSIDEKIDGSIANYLKGMELSQTVTMKNNLDALQKNYNVYWCGQTTGLLTTRMEYGAYYEIHVGSRGTAYGAANTRNANVTSTINGTWLNFPIIKKDTITVGGVSKTIYVINYWEQRKPWITYLGFFIYNGDDYHAWMGTAKKGNFYTENLNPNTNKIFQRQDQWWSPVNGYPTRTWNWAMSIWGIYATKAQNRDAKSIFIYPNAGNTYCWNEDDTTDSSGTSASGEVPIPNLTNSGTWHRFGSGTAYTGSVPVTGYTDPSRATFPWCHTQYTYKDLYDERVRTITGVTKPISDGLLLTSEAGPGTIKMSCSGTVSGNLTVIIKDKNNENILKTQTETVTTSEKTINIDLSNLNEKQDFNVWIKYTPSSRATLKINELTYKRVYFLTN